MSTIYEEEKLYQNLKNLSRNKHIYIYIEGFFFSNKIFSFPLLDNYRRSFRTFGPIWFSRRLKSTTIFS